ncbi:hypothetical protein OEZ86_013253 [Tetradesmus obliquus]|nr:hypothetical protein OEZ86_013253 [Tetradesmus obliquus]
MAPKKKDAEPGGEPGDLKAETEKELVIATLKSRLGRYQETGERLAVEGFKLTDELAKQKLTLQDINEFLTNELKARSVATTQLEERAVALTARLQEVQREAQAEVGRVKAEAAAEVAAAVARAAELSAQLEGSSEFLQQREALEGQLAQLRAALAAKTKEVEQKLSDLERRHLQEKERARQEAAVKVRETKIAMAQLADQHLEGSTKRTLAENQAMAAQLAYHEAANARLVEAHTAARTDAAELRRQLGVAHKTVESTARKNLLLQQTIKAILRCLQQEGALAAGMQGLVPEGCTANVVVLPGPPDSPAASPASRMAAWNQPVENVCVSGYGRIPSPQQEQQQHNTLQDSSSPGLHRGGESSGSRIAQVRSRSSSPVNPMKQRGAGSRACTAQDSSSISKAGTSNGGGAAALSAALDDGVAAFVLYCIQHLRRGAATSPGTQQQQQQQQQQAFGAASPSACSSPVSCRGTGSRSHAEAAGAEGESAGVSAALREQLARLLLDELHGYAQHKVAAFRGLGLALPGLAEGQPGGEGQGTEGQAPGADGAGHLAASASAMTAAAAAAAKADVAGSGQPGDGAAVFEEAGGAGGWQLQQLWLGKEQHQVLPPLPSLLSMAQSAPAAPTAKRTAAQGVGSPGRAASPHSSAAAGAGGDGSSATGSSSQLRLSTEDLFSAVLAEVRPWGACSSSSSSSSLGPGQLISAARALCNRSGDCAGQPPPRQQQQQQEQQQRSRTPTSPAGAQQHSSAAVSGARSPKLLSPKLLSPKHGQLVGRSSSSRGAGSNMFAALNHSAGRLARAAEAAGSCAAGGSLGGALQVTGQPSGASQGQ